MVETGHAEASPQEILKNLYGIIGEEGFQDSRRLKAFIADLYVDSSYMKQRLTYAVAAGLHMYILREPEGRLAPDRLLLIIQTAVAETGMAKDSAEEILRLFAYATGRIEGYEKEAKKVYYASLHPVKVQGKYGYATADREIVIAPIYDKAKPFVEERAKVCRGGLYGFIDRAGNEVIGLRYTEAEDFCNGLAKVVCEGNRLVIDKNGTVQ